MKSHGLLLCRNYDTVCGLGRNNYNQLFKNYFIISDLKLEYGVTGVAVVAGETWTQRLAVNAVACGVYFTVSTRAELPSQMTVMTTLSHCITISMWADLSSIVVLRMSGDTASGVHRSKLPP